MQWIAAQEAQLPVPEAAAIQVTVEKVEIPENLTAETDKP
jgi:deoxycytidine triphosphate deaminase